MCTEGALAVFADARRVSGRSQCAGLESRIRHVPCLSSPGKNCRNPDPNARGSARRFVKLKYGMGFAGSCGTHPTAWQVAHALRQTRHCDAINVQTVACRGMPRARRVDGRTDLNPGGIDRLSGDDRDPMTILKSTIIVLNGWRKCRTPIMLGCYTHRPRPHGRGRNGRRRGYPR